MELNLYAIERIAADRLSELRERAARVARLEAGAPARPRLSQRLGGALIRAGYWLAQGHTVRVRNARVRVAR